MAAIVRYELSCSIAARARSSWNRVAADGWDVDAGADQPLVDQTDDAMNPRHVEQRRIVHRVAQLDDPIGGGSRVDQGEQQTALPRAGGLTQSRPERRA